MHPGIIFLGVIVGSVLFHIYTPWWWTDIASNWGAMDDTINLTFWIGGGVFVLVCLFMVYCVLKFSYKEGRKVEYKPEDHKLEKILTDFKYFRISGFFSFFEKTPAPREITK